MYIIIYVKKVYEIGVYALMVRFTPPTNFEFIPGFLVIDIPIESVDSNYVK
jgi:hypothetical protein